MLEAAKLEAGAEFGEVGKKFKLIEQIGKGASGKVWKATAPDGKSCAIKFIPAPTTDAASKVFHEVVQQLRSVSRFVVPLLDEYPPRAENGWFLFFMSLYTQTLAQVLQKRGSDVLKFWPKWALQIACAVRDIHAADRVHRDIKPDNILIDELYNAFLTDFGLAKFVLAKAVPSQDTGTPGYIPPERLESSLARIPVDETMSHDLFSLGITLLQMKVPWFEAPTTTDYDELLSEAKRAWTNRASTSDELWGLILALLKPERKSNDLLLVIKFLQERGTVIRLVCVKIALQFRLSG